jgi:thiamine biosynthesis protein ThiI
MPAPTIDTVIVRFGGEIGIKAPITRKQYEHRLYRNIKASLKHHAIPHSAFHRKPGRLYIKTSQPKQTADKLSQVFGVSSLSPALETSSSLDEILSISAQLASSTFKHGESFAARCHRVGNHPYTSQEVCRSVGERLLTAFPQLNLSVDLTSPKRTLELEIRDEKAYLFTNVIRGVGGLPLGTQPKLVCLLKGDSYSAVACWMTMKRGCPPILLHVNDNMTSLREVESAKQITKNLMMWSIGFPTRLRVARYNLKPQKLAREYSSQIASLVRKRLMLRIAQRIAEMTNSEGIVTGDSLGRSATYTAGLFRVQDEAVKDLPVYRPLLGLGDDEIASISRGIGLSKAATKKAEQTQAETKTELDEIRKIEDELDSERLIKDTIESMQTLQLQTSTQEAFLNG